jgi:hypothetical protein
MIKIAVKTPTNTVLQKTFFGVSAQIDPTTHVLQIFNKHKVLVAEYPSGSYIWWHKSATIPQLPLTRAAKLLRGV